MNKKCQSWSQKRYEQKISIKKFNTVNWSNRTGEDCPNITLQVRDYRCC